MTNEGSKFNLGAPAGFTPQVTEFKGVLESIYQNSEDRNYQGDAYSVDVAYFDFGDVEIIAATTPSLDDKHQIKMNYSERANTPWDEFRKTLIQFMPAEANGDIMWFIGNVFHMKWAKVQLNKRNEVTDKWGVTDGMGWTVVDIEGLVNNSAALDTTLQDTVLNEIINGNTEADALMAFNQHEGIRSLNGYAEMLTMMTDGSLLNTFSDLGLITQGDNGIWNVA